MCVSLRSIFVIVLLEFFSRNNTKVFCFSIIVYFKNLVFVSEDNMLIASDEKAIVEIADALSRHQTCANLVEAACAAIVPLCLDGITQLATSQHIHSLPFHSLHSLRIYSLFTRFVFVKYS